MKEVYFVTSNKLKFSLASEILSAYEIMLVQHPFKFEELQTISMHETVEHKAGQVMGIVKTSFIVDDSGLRIKALNDFPGALLKDTLTSVGHERFCRILNPDDKRDIEVVNVTAYYDSDNEGLKIFDAVLKGTLAEHPKGINRSNWAIDTIFIPEGGTKTLGEMNDNEWQEYEHFLKSNLTYNKIGAWIKEHQK